MKSVSKQNSPLWEHFDINKDWKALKKASKADSFAPAICRHCQASMKRRNGNTLNMRKQHENHNDRYREFLTAAKEAKVRNKDG